ncbi:MAG: hypothetical protein FD167_4220 [bacterium]|nr:MAG: hypothetical protein FD167_4220 [bacterium]
MFPQVKSGKSLLINKGSKEFDSEQHFQKNKFNSLIYISLQTQSQAFGFLEVARCQKITYLIKTS